MASRGLLKPLQLQTRNSSSQPLVPPFISWISSPKVSCFRHARLFCCHQFRESIDMSDYRNKFAQRMSMAGLKPHHRIAIAVSGGPDSIALCILTAGWKTSHCDASIYGKTKFIDGLLAIVVDHGLRMESAEEASLVYHRITDMGIKCHVAHCNWPDGRPKLGHLQEAARNKRYEIFQDICIQEQIGILLIAHHADDQAELFILRLSRNSSVLGLAGMAFVSQMFPDFPDFRGEGSNNGFLLVRPLLEFSKEDMYNICRGDSQQWVEDPTNRSQLYVRNRIRTSLNNLSSPLFKTELQTVILACRRVRLLVDKICYQLMSLAVTIKPHGYAVIDLGTLNSMEVKDICLIKFITHVLQFISQKHRPVRGSASKLLLCYLKTFPCKTSLTVAGCYLCPTPGSKGTKLLVCCFTSPSLPLRMNFVNTHVYGGWMCCAANELEQIKKESQAYLDKALSDPSNVPFLDITSSESVLIEAQRIGMLSDSTHEIIVSLQKEESENFQSKVEVVSDDEAKNDIISPSGTLHKSISPGQVGYFMNRFLLSWMPCDMPSCEVSSGNELISAEELSTGQCFCCSCITGEEIVAEVRHMVDADWIYLSNLSKQKNLLDYLPQNQVSVKSKHLLGNKITCSDYAILSAQQAIVFLKSIPVAARRAMPVIVNTKGILLSVPSIGFSHCPRLTISAIFKPRIPLGGGYSSFL